VISAVSVSNNSFIAAQTSRASRNSLIANGLVLAIVAGLLWLGGTYYYCFFLGPFPLSDAQLQELGKSGSGLMSYAVLENRRLEPTGWDEIVTRDDRLHERSSYFLMPVGERYMLVLAKSFGDGARLLGPVYHVGTTETEVIDKIVADRPELSGKIMPIMLNHTAAFTVAGYLGLAIFVPTLLLCSINLARAWWGKMHPLQHPLVRQLRRYGDPAGLAEQIDAEMQAGPVMHFGKSTLTSLWLLRPTIFGLTAVPLIELVWIYHVERTSESFAVLSLTTGRQIPVFLKGAQINELIAEIQKRIPWVLCGYSKERYQTWQKNRPAIIADVVQKRDAAGQSSRW
jgi:hypothetical protein